MFVSSNKEPRAASSELGSGCHFDSPSLPREAFASGSLGECNTSWHHAPIPGRKKGEEQTAFFWEGFLSTYDLPINLCLRIKSQNCLTWSSLVAREDGYLNISHSTFYHKGRREKVFGMIVQYYNF